MKREQNRSCCSWREGILISISLCLFFVCIGILVFFIIAMNLIQKTLINPHPDPPPRDIIIYQFADPQVGYGGDPGPPYSTAQRFQYLCDLTNNLETHPHVCAVCGDIVSNWRIESQYEAVKPVLDNFEPPLAVVPGNHDISTNFTLYQFRNRYYGEDYGHQILFGKVLLLLVNSETISNEVNVPSFTQEAIEQYEYFTNILNSWDHSVGPVIIIIHKNPTTQVEFNRWGSPFLDYLCSYNITTVLFGHYHYTVYRFHDCANGLRIRLWSVAGTAKAHDFVENGYGYRIFNVSFSEDFTSWSINQEYIRLDLPEIWP